MILREGYQTAFSIHKVLAITIDNSFAFASKKHIYATVFILLFMKHIIL